MSLWYDKRDMSAFFTYTCDDCGTPFCERILVMNLAMDLVEDAYCLTCLAQREGTEPEAFFEWVRGYIESRNCFKTPWDSFDAAPCPRIADKSCFCEVPAP